MHIVLFTHPAFFHSKSMPKYADFISEGMTRRGHTVQVFTAKAFFCKLPSPTGFKKWLGYLDQFLLFPIILKKNLLKMPPNTLFVFSDQALGPWIPYLVKRPHVVHCHDFLAQRSAKGEIPENSVGFTGRIYQAFIRRGFKKANNFICISEKTHQDLHLLLQKRPTVSKVIYNGLNQPFKFGNLEQARQDLQKVFGIFLRSGYILHVGGNQFYKNRKGVIEIYSAWKKRSGSIQPLLLIGTAPNKELIQAREHSEFSSEIHFLTKVSDDALQKAYHGATFLLFPSLEEGFGWPIAEAMASGCPVVTIDKAPMNEVGGENCFYLPEPPQHREERENWLKTAAETLDRVGNMTVQERADFVRQAALRAKRFCPEKAMEKIERVYTEVLKSYKS